MQHLTEEQLVGLVIEPRVSYPSRERERADSGRQHLGVCPECWAKYEELHDVTSFLGESRAVPPVSAWSRLKLRMERSRRPGRDWTEPRWLPLVSVHLAVIVIAVALILVLGGWLESSSLWEWMRTFKFVSRIGPRGLVGLGFMVVGGFGVLALTPVLWWEFRTRGRKGEGL